MRGSFGQQIITDLPKDQVSQTAPFTYCGVDLLWDDGVRWKNIGHIEVLDSIATDSFIMALRIVISRRGIRQSEMIMGAISQEERIYWKAFTEIEFFANQWSRLVVVD